MNQLKVIEMDKAKLFSIMPKDIQMAYRVSEKDKYYFHVFVPFCHTYAEYLLNQNSFTEYGNFVEAFNKVLQKDETFLYYKETQNSTTGILGMFKRNYHLAKLDDQRIKVEGNEFKLEKDLENELVKAFEEYFGNELKVKRQEYLGYGKSDISLNNTVAIELKKSKAQRKDVYQTFEYSFDGKIETCCLIATEFDPSVLDIAKRLKVDCYSYSFIYENIEGYPIGFWIEKESCSVMNQFDEILNEMDHAVFFNNYNPAFNLDKTFQKKYKTMISIFDRTKDFIESNREEILSHCEELGYDTSRGIEYVIEQIESEEKRSKTKGGRWMPLVEK